MKKLIKFIQISRIIKSFTYKHLYLSDLTLYINILSVDIVKVQYKNRFNFCFSFVVYKNDACLYSKVSIIFQKYKNTFK